MRTWSAFTGGTTQTGTSERPRHPAPVPDDRRLPQHARGSAGAWRWTTSSSSRPARTLGPDWPLQRAPYLLETSLPGVFAVGDIRAGSVKRVASAVGEGSMAVQFVHKVLAE